MPTTNVLTKTDRWLRLLAFALIVTGIALRLYVYVQNRNLIIDEANVARNINERGFIALLSPLSYEQYAPPVFLWMIKLFTALFGMSEMVLRLYPLLAGITSLFLFYSILKKIMPLRAVWYPLGLLVFGSIFIRYASELKQYVPDTLVCLTLIWLALKVDIQNYPLRRFVLLWLMAGSLAIWASMPSVFILAGVGCYYGWQLLSAQQLKRIWIVAGISLFWVGQFAAYYFLMLKAQANSTYLQSFHHYDFLFATPSKREEWQHNWYVFSALMRRFEGLYPYVHDINTAFLICGVVLLIKKRMAAFCLLVVPVLALCMAAAVDQFSLLPRVSLFIIPVIILIIGYGMSQFVYLKSIWLRGIIIIAAVYALGCNVAYLSEEEFKYEELTESMQYVKDKKLPASSVYVYHSSIPAYLYYTSIHPGNEKWNDVKGANMLPWYTNYDSLSWQLRNGAEAKEPVGFLFTNFTEEEWQKKDSSIQVHMKLAEQLDKPYVKACIYNKR